MSLKIIIFYIIDINIQKFKIKKVAYQVTFLKKDFVQS